MLRLLDSFSGFRESQGFSFSTWALHGISAHGFSGRVAGLLLWQLEMVKKQKQKLPGPLKTSLATGTASLWLKPSQGSPDSREGNTKRHEFQEACFAVGN